MSAQQSVNALEVWLGGRAIADLAMNRRQVPQLRYRPDYVEQHGEGSLGLTIPLPVAKRPYRGELVDFWVEGLLPEGETRTVLERYFRIRRGDGFGLLRALGRDCAGAVAVLPSGESPDSAPGDVRPMTQGDVDEAVSQLRQHPLGVDDEVRVSLGGLQSKLLLVKTASGWARPVAGFPSTHILKPDPPEFPGLVASEVFAQQAAGLARLEVADSWLETFGGRSMIVVKRFDRTTADGKLVRIHQEDGCQALGADPSGPGKYQTSDESVSYQRLAGVLAANAADPASELRKLAAMVTFTVAIGNTDAHLRNHALLHRGKTVTLAPVFDAAPTAEFAATRHLALWVGGQSLLAVVTYDHLIREFASWGLGSGPAREVSGATLTALSAAYPDAARLVPEVSSAVVEACQQRTVKLLRQAG